jgi:hypothetical protein
VEVFAVETNGEPHQALVVDFVSTQALRKAAKALLESHEPLEQDAPLRGASLR